MLAPCPLLFQKQSNHLSFLSLFYSQIEIIMNSFTDKKEEDSSVERAKKPRTDEKHDGLLQTSVDNLPDEFLFRCLEYSNHEDWKR